MQFKNIAALFLNKMVRAVKMRKVNPVMRQTKEIMINLKF